MLTVGSNSNLGRVKLPLSVYTLQNQSPHYKVVKICIGIFVLSYAPKFATDYK